MREKPLVERVDVVTGPEGDERLITVAKSIADRWPDDFRPATTKTGRPNAKAKRARDQRDVDPAPVIEAADLPSAPTTSSAIAAADTTAGDAGVTTEGVTS